MDLDLTFAALNNCIARPFLCSHLSTKWLSSLNCALWSVSSTSYDDSWGRSSWMHSISWWNHSFTDCWNDHTDFWSSFHSITSFKAFWCSMNLISILNYLFFDDGCLVTKSLSSFVRANSASRIWTKIFDLSHNNTTLSHLSQSTWLHIVKDYTWNLIQVVLTSAVCLLLRLWHHHWFPNADEATSATFIISNELVNLWLLGHIFHHRRICGNYSITTTSLSSQRLRQDIISLIDHANLLNSIYWIVNLGGCWRLSTLGWCLLKSSSMLFCSHFIKSLLWHSRVCSGLSCWSFWLFSTPWKVCLFWLLLFN